MYKLIIDILIIWNPNDQRLVVRNSDDGEQSLVNIQSDHFDIEFISTNLLYTSFLLFW